MNTTALLDQKAERTPVSSEIELDARHRTVVGWDGSPPSRSALTWAIDRECARDGHILVVRIVDDTTGSPEYVVTDVTQTVARRALHDEVDRIRKENPSLHVEGELISGDPATSLSSYSGPGTLLVVGTHVRSAPVARFEWSIGTLLAAAAIGPVAIVPEGFTGGTTRAIVVGIDGSGAGRSAVAFATDEAVLRDYDLCAVHAVEKAGAGTSNHVPEDLTHVHQRVLDGSLADASRSHPSLQIEQRLIHANAQRALLDSARAASLLVIGVNSSEHSEPPMRLGAVAHSLILNLVSPTIVLKTARLSSQGTLA